MAHEWDGPIAHEALRLGPELAEWFPRSHRRLTEGFASRVEQELRALRRAASPQGDAGLDIPVSSCRAAVEMEMISGQLRPGLSAGKVLLGLGSLAFCRNRALRSLAGLGSRGLLTTAPVCEDLISGGHADVASAFSRGDLTPPDFGERRIRYFRRVWSGEERRWRREERSVSARMLQFSLRIFTCVSLFATAELLAPQKVESI